MDPKGKVALVTGAGRGIGRALCRELARRGAAAIVAADLDAAAAEATASESGGLGVACDVSDEAAVRQMVAAARERFGRIDLLISNAGFGGEALDTKDALSAPNDVWQRMWDVHVMAHVYACRAVLPEMLERGEGCLINVASAAGLLSQVGDSPYSATKHAAVSLAESLAITYGDRGIQVSVVCPQYVATSIIGMQEQTADGSIPGVMNVDSAASAIVDGIEGDEFPILTHPEVLGYFRNKGADYRRWLSGMRKVRDGLQGVSFLKIKS